MTHLWTVPDGAWLADSRWACTRCGVDVQFYVDTGSAPPCRGRWWPWDTQRIAEFRARLRLPSSATLPPGRVPREGVLAAGGGVGDCRTALPSP